MCVYSCTAIHRACCRVKKKKKEHLCISHGCEIQHIIISVLKTLALIVLHQRRVSEELFTELQTASMEVYSNFLWRGKRVKFCIKEPHKSLAFFSRAHTEEKKKKRSSFAWTLRWGSSEGSPKRFRRVRAEAGGVGDRDRERERTARGGERVREWVIWRGRKAGDWWRGTKSGSPSSGLAASVKMTFWG